MSYLMLDPNFQVRKEQNKAILFDKRVEYILKKPLFISLSDFNFLKLLNGMYTKNDLVEFLVKFKNIDYSFSLDIVNRFINKFNDYILYLEVQKNRKDIEIKINKDCISKYKYKCGERLMVPLSISIVLTENCFCSCKYCYANGSTGNNDILTTRDVLKILEECYEIGVATVNLSGGDPFSRSDIFEILKHAENLGLNYSISTKKIFSDEDINQLILSKVKEIQISVDSDNDEICKQLIGIEKYFTKQKQIIKKLLNAGIKVKINIVVTKINIKTIPNLVNELLMMGVNKIFLSPYINSLGRHNDIFFCDKTDHQELKKELPINDKIDYKAPNYDIKHYQSINEIPLCTGGRMGLVVFSDGNIGICERLPKDLLNIGNIKNSSLVDLWNSKKLKDIIEPSREEFIGDKCYTCDKFEQCVLKKGICYVRSSIANQNKVFSSDPYCPMSNKYIKMF